MHHSILTRAWGSGEESVNYCRQMLRQGPAQIQLSLDGSVAIVIIITLSCSEARCY